MFPRCLCLGCECVLPELRLGAYLWVKKAYEDGPPCKANPEEWTPRRKDVIRAIRIANASAPGPDGIPYAAWKQAAEGAINILWAALRTINTENDTTKHYPDFNQAILVCLPPKTTIITPDGTQAFHSNNTRPLAISNMGNRLLAAACRIRWEGLAKDAVHQHQRGFLPGRSMLANITEIDHIAHLMALEEDDPAMVLYDFTAAFPSISRHFTIQALEAFGAPRLAT